MQFYPAKNQYDVRFFGGQHTRAMVNVKFIKPIDTPMPFTLKKNVRLQKAMDELLDHQSLIKQRESNHVNEYSSLSKVNKRRKTVYMSSSQPNGISHYKSFCLEQPEINYRFFCS